MGSLAVALMMSLAVAHPGDVTALPEVNGVPPPDLQQSAPGRSGPRIATLVGSAAIVATGIGLMAWGLARAQDTSLGFTCMTGCSGGLWARIYRTADPSDGIDVTEISGTGAALFPLGLSFVAAGSTTVLGSELLESGEVPWVSLLAGVVVGSVMYGVFEATESGITAR